MSDADRRRFFRINDTIRLSYRVLSDEEIQSQLGCVIDPSDAQTLLANYDKTIKSVLGQLKIEQPLVAEVLAAMNGKINRVIDQLDIDSQLVEQIAHKIREVNISACGVAFNVDEPIDIGKVLLLDLLLQPDDVHIFVHCAVIMRGLNEHDGSCYIRVNFSNMSTSDQELLIQHIVRRQGIQLRNAKDDDSKDT
jgi:c-di-GMP-binding flagellar brake protein YcgR